jgi:hypothetical protein
MARRCRDRQWFMSISSALTPHSLFWSYPHILCCADPFSTLLHKEAHNHVFRNLTSIPCLAHSRIGVKSLIGLSLLAVHLLPSITAALNFIPSSYTLVINPTCSFFPQSPTVTTFCTVHYSLFFLSILSTCTYVSLLRSSIPVDPACTL